MEVFHLEVYLIANIEVGSWTSFRICWSLVALLHFQHLRLQEVVELVQICDIRLGGGGSKFAIGVDREIGILSLVGEERGYACGSTGHVVVGEFCKGK